MTDIRLTPTPFWMTRYTIAMPVRITSMTPPAANVLIRAESPTRGEEGDEQGVACGEIELELDS